MVSDAGLKVLFLGTPQFAVPTLDAILASSHTVVGVVTQPDKPRGRGQKASDAPVKARASERGLPTLQPPTLKDPEVLDQMRALGADIGVVAAYGKILPQAVLDLPRLGMINVHASLLPRWRGAAPVHRSVIAGDGKTGVTIMRVVKALDAGAMLATVERPIGPDDTSDEVERDLGALGAALLVQTLDRLALGPIEEAVWNERTGTLGHLRGVLHATRGATLMEAANDYLTLRDDVLRRVFARDDVDELRLVSTTPTVSTGWRRSSRSRAT